MRKWRRHRCATGRRGAACARKRHSLPERAVTPVLQTRMRSSCRRRADFTGRGFGIARRRETR